MARGFAYVEANGDIWVTTVSPTELAAKVNAIVMLSHNAIIPRADWDEETIDYWLGGVMSRLGHKGRIAEVCIELAG